MLYVHVSDGMTHHPAQSAEAILSRSVFTPAVISSVGLLKVESNGAVQHQEVCSVYLADLLTHQRRISPTAPTVVGSASTYLAFLLFAVHQRLKSDTTTSIHCLPSLLVVFAQQ